MNKINLLKIFMLWDVLNLNAKEVKK